MLDLTAINRLKLAFRWNSLCVLSNPFMPSGPRKGTLANSVEPDQTPQIAAFDLVTHCCIKYRNLYKTWY